MRQGLQPGDPEWIGPYRVIGCLGEGGMGRVYLCRSQAGRKLAVKVVHEDRAAYPVFRERFRREVEAARKVDGLHTAGVVDAQLDGPVLWLATAYGGRSLESVVREHGPLPADSLLALAAGLAEGLAAIHRNGIVHRDLKPSNVLLAEDGPRVIDFGISRAAGDSGLTDVGLVMGTPRFMSPEQVWGRTVGPPSDVFSLGSVLAFAGTGHPPFGEDGPDNVARRIRHEPPWLGGLPPEVRDLAGRCLTRNPAKRPTPDALIAELGDTHLAEGWLPGRFLTRPTPAPASAPGAAPRDVSVDTARLRRWGLPKGLTLLYSRPLVHPEALWQQVRRLARSWVRGPRIVLVAAVVAVIALLTTGLTVLAAGHGPGAFRPQLGRTLSYPGSIGLTSVAFSADNGLIAVADSNGTAGVWTVATGAPATTVLTPGRAGVADVAFGPHGLLAAAADNGNSYLWDTATGGRVGTFTDPDSPGVTGAAFSPDGSLLATADDNGSAYLWAAGTGRLVRTFTEPGSGRLTGVAFGPVSGANGGLLAVAGEDGSAYLWRTGTGRLAGTFTDPGGGVIQAVAFSSDGSLLATADSNGNAYVWSVATGKLDFTLRGPGPGSGGGVADVVFSAHGYLVATADSNGNTYVWTVATGKVEQDQKPEPAAT